MVFHPFSSSKNLNQQFPRFDPPMRWSIFSNIHAFFISTPQENVNFLSKVCAFGALFLKKKSPPPQRSPQFISLACSHTRKDREPCFSSFFFAIYSSFRKARSVCSLSQSHLHTVAFEFMSSISCSFFAEILILMVRYQHDFRELGVD